jgi:hypothetical protein
MLRFQNEGWVADVDDLLNHVGEEVELHVDSDEWGIGDVKGALRGVIKDHLNKEDTERYHIVVNGWSSQWWCKVQLVDTWSLKKTNNELLFLLKKGE